MALSSPSLFDDRIGALLLPIQLITALIIPHVSSESLPCSFIFSFKNNGNFLVFFSFFPFFFFCLEESAELSRFSFFFFFLLHAMQASLFCFSHN